MGLYRVAQCADVFVDACVRNEAGSLVFMSVFGRDTAIRELLARIQLGGKGAEGLTDLRLESSADNGASKHLVSIANAQSLDKVTGRLPKCLYGQLTHTWVFDPVIKAPNKGAGLAWVIEEIAPHSAGQVDAAGRNRIADRLWLTVQKLAGVPLLPHWRDNVLASIWKDMIFQMGKNSEDAAAARRSVPIGPLCAYRVQLTEDFPARVSRLIREGELQIDTDSSNRRPRLAGPNTAGS